LNTFPESSPRQGDHSELIVRRFRRSENPEDFSLALGLRTQVFVDEQKVPPEREQDEYEDECLHWLMLEASTGNPVATGRMRAYQEGCQMRPVAKLERIAVNKNLRGRKLGERLMRDMLATIQANGYEQVILDAQTPVLGFYEQLGFVAEGDEFMDACIPHYRMRLAFE
jgi:predicted GNAT family N-acyltransferase